MTEEYAYPGGWFGESWGAPACDPDRHKPTPAGTLCPQCGSEITDGDQGMIIPAAGAGGVTLEGWHLSCFLATVLPRRYM